MKFGVEGMGAQESIPKPSSHLKHCEMQQRPFIKTGYRESPLTAIEALSSIFQIHNETGNIWTHLIGGIYFLYVLYHVLTLDVRADLKTLLIINAISYMLTMFFSVVYHTFIAHSYKVAKCCYKCDLCGISLAIYNGIFTGVYVGFLGLDGAIRGVYLVISFVLLVLGIAAPFWKRFEPYRTIFLTISGVVAFLIYVHWVILADAERVEYLGLEVVKAFVFLGAGFLFYSAAWPERTSNSGRFDIWFSSHQFWHIFVFLAVYFFQTAFEKYTMFVTSKEFS
jgi:adiponectin receptor